jgi:transposase-like protein
VVKAGFRMTRRLGRRQRYLCQDCGRTFYAEAARDERALVERT